MIIEADDFAILMQFDESDIVRASRFAKFILHDCAPNSISGFAGLESAMRRARGSGEFRKESTTDQHYRVTVTTGGALIYEQRFWKIGKKRPNSA